MATMSGMAARGLGAVETTLRRWEERGLLATGDPPRAVPRFRRDDVAELEALVFSGFPPIVEVELPSVSVEKVDG